MGIFALFCRQLRYIMGFTNCDEIIILLDSSERTV